MGTRLIHKNQRGFSLIELLIVIALAALVTTGITTTIFQVFNMNSRTANRMAAVSQVQDAGKLVSEDILEAQSVNASGSKGFPLILTRTAQNLTAYAVTYNITVDNKLQRSLKITPDGEGSTTEVSIVAEYIAINQTSCAPLGVLTVGDALKFTVTATVGGQSETRVYEVKPRSESL